MDKSAKICLWCKGSLPKRRRKYCSDECADEYFIHFIKPFWWGCARDVALERAGNKCEDCGVGGKLEVHHIIPLEPYEVRHNSPQNRQDNLRVLCRPCHEKAHHELYLQKKLPKSQMVMELNK